MDDEQQGAWWITPPRSSTPPSTRRAGPPDDEIEVRDDDQGHDQGGWTDDGTDGGRLAQTDAEPSLFIPMPTTGQTPVVRPPVIRPPETHLRRPSPVQPSGPPSGPAPWAPPGPPPGPLAPTATSRVDIDPPTRPVEYLTVRLDPDPDHRGFSDTMEVPAAAMPRLRQASPDEDQAPPSFRRGPAILLGVGVLVVIVVVAVVASIVATGVDAGRDRSSAGSSATTAATLVGGTVARNLTQVSGTRARAMLNQAGATAAGNIRQSFTWDDDNGKNLLVTAADRTGSGAGARTTLTVVQVAGLDTRPRILRTMIDPNLPECTGAVPKAEFTAGSMFVRDLNGDGTAEATIGWSSRCGQEDRARSVAKLAVLSGGRKFIIRGEGVIGHDGTALPDPVAAKWPRGFRTPALKLYRALYF